MEEGTPAELLRREGSYYRRMVRMEGKRAFQTASTLAGARAGKWDHEGVMPRLFTFGSCQKKHQ